MDPSLFWEAGKAYLRGSMTAYTRHYRKEKTKKCLQASRRLRKAQMSYQNVQDAQTKEEWRVAKLHFETCQDVYEQWKGNVETLKFHKFGNKAVRLLARLAKGPYIAMPIHSLIDNNGKTHRDPGLSHYQ